MPDLPDWSQSAHSYVTALALAKASQAAYCLADYSPANWGKEYGFAIEEVKNEKEGMYAFASSQEDTIVFAVRGTDQKSDWGVNIDMGHTTVPNIPGRVHEGFWSSGLGPLLDGLLKELQKNDYRKIWITGHSLGGAIAVLFQSHLIFKNNRMVTGLYTFGQPRVGDQTFRDKLDSHTTGQYHRYVNHNDVVPLVPSHFQGYRHAGSPVRFDRHGIPQFQDDIVSRFRSFLDNLDEQLDSLVKLGEGEGHNAMLKRIREAPTEGVKEHSIALYVKAIENVIAQG